MHSNFSFKDKINKNSFDKNELPFITKKLLNINESNKILNKNHKS